MDLYSHPDTNHSAKHQPRENAIVPYNPDNMQETSIDPYDSDMTPSIQEALHRSNMDIRYPNDVLSCFLNRYTNSWCVWCLESWTICISLHSLYYLFFYAAPICSVNLTLLYFMRLSNDSMYCSNYFLEDIGTEMKDDIGTETNS